MAHASACNASVNPAVDKYATYLDLILDTIIFSDFNMLNYPPGNQTSFSRACHILQDESQDVYGKMDNFFDLVSEANDVEPDECGFDLRIQIPAGRNASIMTSDWTGAGFGEDGNSWDFHCCTELIVQTGFSKHSMFYPMKWTMDWLVDHCQTRYGISPTPYKLVDEYGFNDLSKASRIIFTNGLLDGWSEYSILEAPNDNVVVINLPNGAHHSDLSHTGPSENDTDDIQAAFSQIQDQLTEWFDEINDQMKM
jgi:Serine carboxypeptidase S28